MRDYILTEAIARDSTFAFPKLRRVVRNWVFKRTLKALQQLDDHMLHDIGLARDELRHLTALPLDVDLMAELIRLRDLRARHAGASEERGHLAVERPHLGTHYKGGNVKRYAHHAPQGSARLSSYSLE